ncbi:hypothetical protein [uncultured Thiodictyon sp.]|uniref:hypothetical protein n=1 Tax=uncultured Thiodictyon sp. TaxID=1846217 RepID=UPI0025E46DD7|nr:hypothetical protein [uncultured Thiodictyon sp.]
MTEHMPIQDPEDFSPEDLMRLAEVLFSPLSGVNELERACMTLAHLPTAEAQDLLKRFTASSRAAEVSWLECAVEEGQQVLMEPTNDLEEREFLTLKVIQELTDESYELEAKRDQQRVSIEKGEIRLGALQALAAAGKYDPIAVLGYSGGIDCERNDMDELTEEIALKEAMIEHLRASITTPRYRDVDPEFMRHVHWDA